jgi:hypothetical protein
MIGQPQPLIPPAMPLMGTLPPQMPPPMRVAQSGFS